MEKYYNASAFGTIITLFRRMGLRKIEKRISPNTFTWYFCVEVKQVKKHEQVFRDLKDQGFIDSIIVDENPIYYRIYCENKNIWRGNREEVDAKRHILHALNRKRIRTYEADLSSAQRYMLDNNIKIEDRHKIGFYDFETKDDLDGVEVGRDPILCAALVDADGTEWVYQSDNEYALLQNVLKKFSEYTMLCGWNSSAFDWPLLKMRCKVHDIKFNLFDINQIDLMNWFEKAVQANSIAERPIGFGLESVGEQYLGMNKTEGVHGGQGRILKLSKTDPERLKEYNLQDCRICKKFSDFFKATDLLTQQSVIAGVFPGWATPTSLTDGVLLKQARAAGRRLITKKNSKKLMARDTYDKKGKLIPGKEIKAFGGRVHLSQPGVYDNVLGFDFAGYYATIMRYFNIGPDTLLSSEDLTKIPEKKRNFPLIISPYTYLAKRFLRELSDLLLDEGVIVDRKSTVVPGIPISKMPYLLAEITKDKAIEKIEALYETVSEKFTMGLEAFLAYFFKFTEEGKCIKIEMPYPSFFRHDIESIVTITLEDYTDKRNKYKADRKELIAREVDESEMAYQQTDLMISTYKLLGNIVFGQQSNVFARIFNYGSGPSICLGAQFITMFTKSWFEVRGCIVIYMDTDSNYVWLRHRSQAAMDDLLKDFRENYQNDLHKMVTSVFGISPKRNFPIELEYEKIWRRLILIAKKHYIGIKSWEAGKGEVNKLEMRGIELRRRGSCEIAKKIMVKAIDKILQPKDIPSGDNIFNWFSKVKDKFLTLKVTPENVQDFAKHIKINKKPSEYKLDTPQKRCVERIFARGDHFDIGTMLSYIIVSVGKQTEFIELEHFKKHPEKYNVNYEHYWDKEIFSPNIRIFENVYSDQPWIKLSLVDAAISEKMYEQKKRRILGKKSACERDKTYGMIKKYQKFCSAQRIELLELFIKHQKVDNPYDKNIKYAEKLIERIKSGDFGVV